VIFAALPLPALIAIQRYIILMKTHKSLPAVASVAKGNIAVTCILFVLAAVCSCEAQSAGTAAEAGQIPPDAMLEQKKIIRAVVNDTIPTCEADIQKAIGTPIRFDVQWPYLITLRTSIESQNRTSLNEAVGLVEQTVKCVTKALEKIALDPDGKDAIAHKIKKIVVSAKSWNLNSCPPRPGEKPDPDKRPPYEKYVSLSDGTLFVFIHLFMKQPEKPGEAETVQAMDYPNEVRIKESLTKLL